MKVTTFVVIMSFGFLFSSLFFFSSGNPIALAGMVLFGPFFLGMLVSLIREGNENAKQSKEYKHREGSEWQKYPYSVTQKWEYYLEHKEEVKQMEKDLCIGLDGARPRGHMLQNRYYLIDGVRHKGILVRSLFYLDDLKHQKDRMYIDSNEYVGAVTDEILTAIYSRPYYDNYTWVDPYTIQPLGELKQDEGVVGPRTPYAW